MATALKQVGSLRASSWPSGRCTAAALIAAALAACGGDGGDSSESATITAAPDSAAVAWNASTPIDVLANDKASVGEIELVGVSAPQHGTAAIAGGKLSYTPTAGYFGTDTMHYTVRAKADGATADATVDLTVMAEMRLKGVAADSPLAGAMVKVTVGDRTFEATADADGRFGVDIATAQGEAAVTIEAAGIGPQSRVRLVSLAGDAGSLAGLAAKSGEIDSARIADLNSTHLSTALAALITEANGGTRPASRARVRELSALVSSERLTDLATAIALVADHGVALPDGADDTMALVDQPGTSHLLADFLTTQSQGANAARFADARAKVLSAATVSAGAPVVAADRPKSHAYFVGYKAHGALGQFVTYRPDGTASVVAYNGTGEASWKTEDGAIVLTLVKPISEESYSEDVDGCTGNQVMTRRDTTGYRVRQVTGDESAGLVLGFTVGSTTRLEGCDAGKAVPFDISSGSLVKMVDMDQAEPLTAADMSTGTVWAGMLGNDDLIGIYANRGTDSLEITGAGTGRYTRSGTDKTWAMDGYWLVVSDGSVERRYARLSRDAGSGEEHWLVHDIVAGKARAGIETMMIRVDPDASWVADASLFRHWESGITSGGPVTEGSYLFDLYSDGTGADVSMFPGEPLSKRPTTWAIGSDGSLTMTRVQEGPPRLRTWYLLRRNAGTVYVMENLHMNSSDNWRMNVYTDAGPASS